MNVQSRYDKVIQAIEDFIENRPKDYWEDMPSPEELSDMFLQAGEYYGLNGKDVNRIFQFMTDQTFKQYFDMRVDMYLYSILLEQTKYDISTLMNIAGTTESNLIKRFKKTFGEKKTPSTLFKNKDRTLYQKPASWDTCSEEQHRKIEALLSEIESLKESEAQAKENEKLARLAEAQAKEKASVANAHKRVLVYIIIFIILSIAGISAYKTHIDKLNVQVEKWSGSYNLFRLYNGFILKSPSSRITIDYKKNKAFLHSDDYDKPFELTIQDLNKDSIKFYSEELKISYTGAQRPDGVIELTEDGQGMINTIYLIREDLYQSLLDKWDGKFQVQFYTDENPAGVYLDLTGNFFVILLNGGMINMVSIDTAYSGYITLVNNETLEASFPEYCSGATVKFTSIDNTSFSITYPWGDSNGIIYRAVKIGDIQQ